MIKGRILAKRKNKLNNLRRVTSFKTNNITDSYGKEELEDKVTDLETKLKEAEDEATELAIYLWMSYYTEQRPNLVLSDTVSGIIRQIDSMIEGIEPKDKAP